MTNDTFTVTEGADGLVYVYRPGPGENEEGTNQ
jgi:hypothetical protein